MKPYLFAIVILTVASLGNTSFAQDATSARSREERVKEAMTTPKARKGIATGSVIAGAGFAYSALRVSSESLDKINGKIDRIKFNLEQKNPTLIEKERILTETKALHSTEEIEANRKMILEASKNLKNIKPEALAKVGGTPGDLESYLAKQQTELEAAAQAHALTIQEKQALITQADQDLKSAISAATPEIQSLNWELKSALYSKRGFMIEAVTNTLGARVIKLATAGALAFIAYHEVYVLRANSSEPQAATIEETNEVIKAINESK